MSDPVPPYLTIAEAGRLIARKKLSPVDLTKALLKRIEAVDPTLNAFLLVTGQRAPPLRCFLTPNRQVIVRFSPVLRLVKTMVKNLPIDFLIFSSKASELTRLSCCSSSGQRGVASVG